MRRSSAIALDLGEHSVKALQLERRGDVMRVRDASCARVESDPAKPRRDRLVAAGQRALRGRSFRGSRTMLALRLGDIATRHIRVPADKLEHAGEIISRQVGDQANGQELSICPIPVVDLFDQGEMKREYLCCIATAQAIQDVIEVTEALGLVPDGIDIEPCAQARPFLLRPGHDTVLYLDVGLRSSRITVVRGGSALTMRTVKVGSEDFDTVLRRHLQMDVETLCRFQTEAERRPELEEAVIEAISQPLEGILQRIAASIRYCAALFQGRAATLIRVCGGAASLPGLVAYTQRRLGIDTQLADPFDGVDTSGVPGLGASAHPGFATAMGLALREVAL